MKDSRPSFILFVMASTGVIVGKIFDWELLMLLTKPMVVPAIFYYYLQTKTKNTNLIFSMVMFLFFLGDMIILLDPKSGLLGIMICAMLAHLLLIKLAFEDRLQLKFSFFNLFFLTLLLLLPSYILYLLLNLNEDSIDKNYLLFLVYGVVLIFLVGISIINHLSHHETSSLYMSAMAISLMLSDVLYSIAHFILDLPLLDHINLAIQFMAYYFMVKYFNSRKTEVRKVTQA